MEHEGWCSPQQLDTGFGKVQGNAQRNWTDQQPCMHALAAKLYCPECNLFCTITITWLQVLPATYNPADPVSERQEVAVGALFLMMGRGLERLPVSLLGA